MVSVVARLSSGPGPPPEDEAEGLERPELFGTKNRGNCQVDIPHAKRVRKKDWDRYEVCSTWSLGTNNPQQLRVREG